MQKSHSQHRGGRRTNSNYAFLRRIDRLKKDEARILRFYDYIRTFVGQYAAKICNRAKAPADSRRAATQYLKLLFLKTNIVVL
jgi:hypothetical protein